MKEETCEHDWETIEIIPNLYRECWFQELENHNGSHYHYTMCQEGCYKDEIVEPGVHTCNKASKRVCLECGKCVDDGIEYQKQLKYMEESERAEKHRLLNRRILAKKLWEGVHE